MWALCRDLDFKKPWSLSLWRLHCSKRRMTEWVPAHITAEPLIDDDSHRITRHVWAGHVARHAEEAPLAIEDIVGPDGGLRDEGEDDSDEEDHMFKVASEMEDEVEVEADSGEGEDCVADDKETDSDDWEVDSMVHEPESESDDPGQLGEPMASDGGVPPPFPPPAAAGGRFQADPKPCETCALPFTIVGLSSPSCTGTWACWCCC